MLQRHEYLAGSTKVDRDWWIITKTGGSSQSWPPSQSFAP